MPEDRKPEPILRWFATAHLPERIRPLVEAYADLGKLIADQVDPSPERTIALRDLVASKDNAVRAFLETAVRPDAE